MLFMCGRAKTVMDMKFLFGTISGVLGITDEGGPKAGFIQFLWLYLFKSFMVLVISPSHRRCIAIVYFSFLCLDHVICDRNVIRDMVLCKLMAQV